MRMEDDENARAATLVGGPGRFSENKRSCMYSNSMHNVYLVQSIDNA